MRQMCATVLAKHILAGVDEITAGANHVRLSLFFNVNGSWLCRRQQQACREMRVRAQQGQQNGQDLRERRSLRGLQQGHHAQF